MYRNGIYLLFTIAMLSSAARAFSTPARSLATNRSVKSISFLVRSMSTTEEGDTSIVDRCKDKIMKHLDTEDVTVTGAYDDPNGSHISITVVSDQFEGKRAVQRQQMVYKALWDELAGPVHAVDAMICKTPEEK
mmetsp:Transcript_19637/g.28986  ORF Transcript_19637/g.28986 Transcript_19637/m.28986 type:complete len:134 (-) Transcript_19637:147-548(-)